MYNSSITKLQIEIDHLKAENTKLKCECDTKHKANELYVQCNNHHKHVIHNNDSKVSVSFKLLQKNLHLYL